ncbi:uncharacterized protein [Palaemon carinicauda]|uniref:uncharacterized protein n=1 Tax=Palaemon carinicauda TaxID=392227 RepID=UPI0035B574EC
MPLVHAFTRQSDARSIRRRRHLSAVAECNCTAQHVPGKMNPVADAPSRNTLVAIQGHFAHIHVNVVGPLPTLQGHRYRFIVIDCSTRWRESLPMETLTSALRKSALLSGWITRFDIPEHITSDRALMSRCKDSNWFTQLPWILLGLMITPKDVLDASASEMLYGDPLVIPAKYFPSATSSDDLHCIRQVVEKYTSCRQTYKHSAKHHIPTDVHSALHVFLRNETSNAPLTPPCTGPFLVI